jgi:hypothetical protein
VPGSRATRKVKNGLGQLKPSLVSILLGVPESPIPATSNGAENTVRSALKFMVCSRAEIYSMWFAQFDSLSLVVHHASSMARRNSAGTDMNWIIGSH